MVHLDEIGKWDLLLNQRVTRGRVGIVPTDVIAKALAEISEAVVLALREIVKRGFLGRFLDWATGSRSSGLQVRFEVWSRAWHVYARNEELSETTSQQHSLPSCSACFGLVTISDYRDYRGTTTPAPAV